MICSRLEKQLQEHLHLKKSVASLPTVIGVLGSHLGPHPESDITTDLYSCSTLIAIMDESDCHISFNSLNKSVTSLPVVIGALGSPLVPHPESDLATNLYSASTPITNMDESNRWISFNRLNKFAISLSGGIEGIRLSFSTPSRKRSMYRSIFFLYSYSYQGRVQSPDQFHMTSRNLQYHNKRYSRHKALLQEPLQK
jgi:hypothetical protein